MTDAGGGMPGESLDLPDDFVDFIDSMQAHAVDFVLVGAHAVAAHGIVRATGDIDILYRQSAENIDRLCLAMRAFGAPTALIDPEFMRSRDAIIQVGLPPFRIDLLSSISGVTFDEAWSGAIRIALGQAELRVLGLRELLVNKRAVARPRDLDDVRRLEAAVVRGSPQLTSTKKGSRRKR